MASLREINQQRKAQLIAQSDTHRYNLDRHCDNLREVAGKTELAYGFLQTAVKHRGTILVLANLFAGKRRRRAALWNSCKAGWNFFSNSKRRKTND